MQPAKQKPLEVGMRLVSDEGVMLTVERIRTKPGAITLVDVSASGGWSVSMSLRKAESLERAG